MKPVFFVPIKLESQRLPNKMLLKLGDKLLCQYIFDILVKVKKRIDIDIYCFCSDEKIKKYLPKEVFFLKRDKKLDKNETKGLEIYKSFCGLVKANIYGLFHATSPFINIKSIIKGLEKVINNTHDSSFSVSKIQTFCWYNNETLNYSLDNVVRTQDIKPVYWETSAFYIFKSDILNKFNRRIGKTPYLVETDRLESIDIDEKEDFIIASKILEN